MHKIVVRDGAAEWQRDLQVTGGTVNIAANLAKRPVQHLASK
jgi:hypothetical protein